MIWNTLTYVYFGFWALTMLLCGIASCKIAEEGRKEYLESLIGISKAINTAGCVLAVLGAIGIVLNFMPLELKPLGAKEMQRTFYEGGIFEFGKYPRAVGGYLKGSYAFVLIAAALCLLVGLLLRVMGRSRKMVYGKGKPIKGMYRFLRMTPLIAVLVVCIFVTTPLFHRVLYVDAPEAGAVAESTDGAAADKGEAEDNEQAEPKKERDIWEYLLSKKAIVEFAHGEKTEYWQPMGFAFGSMAFVILFGGIWYGLPLYRKMNGLASLLVFIVCMVLAFAFAVAFYPLLGMVMWLIYYLPALLLIGAIGSVMSHSDSSGSRTDNGDFLDDMRRREDVRWKIRFFGGSTDNLSEEDQRFVLNQLQLNRFSKEELQEISKDLNRNSHAGLDDRIREKAWGRDH